MRSKADVIEAVKTCLFLDGRCANCPYDDLPTPDCVNSIIKDLEAFLNKNDFEVMQEILSRSKDMEGHYGLEKFLIGFTEHNYIALYDGADEVDLIFDAEGNIL